MIKQKKQNKMKKATFTNNYFYYFLIIFFAFLFVSNIYYIYFDNDLFILIPIIIQMGILFLLIYKYYRIKLILKIWSGFFLVLANSLIFFGKLLKDFSNDFQYFDLKNYFGCIIMLIIGIIILWLTEQTVIIYDDK